MSIKMPDDYIGRLSQLGDTLDSIVENMLQEGGDILYEQMASNLDSSIGRNLKHESRSTGELRRSLGVTKVRVDSNGIHNIKVGFDEPRSNDQRNAEIAAILEYGKSGQPAKPFAKPAVRKSKKAVIDAMDRVMDQAVKKL